eukprot:208110-Rhodomonas_salina.2
MLEGSSSDERPEALTVGRLLRSRKRFCREREREQRVVTLVTHLSADRLETLKITSQTWYGSIVAAIFVLREEEENVVAMHNVLAEIRFRFLFALGSTVSVWADDHRDRPYPINAVRNAALAHAETDLVLLSDVDQAPCADTAAWLKIPVGSAICLRLPYAMPGTDTAYVLPGLLLAPHTGALRYRLRCARRCPVLTTPIVLPAVL